MADDEKLKWISYIKIVGIILVVIYHSFHEYPDGINGNSLLLNNMMASFRMPLFVFASGVVLSYGCARKKSMLGYGRFCWYKFQRLMIPYFVLLILVFPIRSIMSNMADDAVEMNINSLVNSLVYTESLTILFFWFLPMSYICQLIGYAGYCIRGINIYVYYVVISVLSLGLYFSEFLSNVSFFSLKSVGEYLIFFVLGMVCGINAKKFISLIKWDSVLVFMIFAILWYITYCWHERSVVNYVCSLSGICMMISFVNVLVKYNVKVLDHLEGATYMIFLLSWFCNVGSQQVLHYFTDFPWWIYTITSIFTAIYIPWLVYKFLLKYSGRSRVCAVTSYLLGYNFKK